MADFARYTIKSPSSLKPHRLTVTSIASILNIQTLLQTIFSQRLRDKSYMVDGPQFYDDNEIFETYYDGRKRPDNPNDTLDKPTILELMGNVKYADVLDLGCGTGDFGSLLISMGCQSYTGVEASYNMITTAQKSLTSSRAKFIYSRIENCDFPPDHYHLIVSRLALHYIDDLADLFTRLRPALKQQGGRFVFSVEHPVLTSHNESSEISGKRSNWIVDNYFLTGKREVKWMGKKVTKYHRTVEDYFTLLQDADFKILSLRESNPRRENFTNESEFKRRQRIPMFLFFSVEP